MSLAEEAVDTIYALCDQPARICAPMLRTLCTQTFPDHVTAGGSPDVAWAETVVNGDQVADMPVTVDGAASVTALSSLFVVMGQVALKQLVYVEEIQAELKHRRHSKPKPTTTRVGSSGVGSDNEEDLSDQLGLGAAAQDDEEAEYVHKVCENELVLHQPGMVMSW